jgi:hypothetical protein
MSVKVVRCKPNPAGTDTIAPGRATPAQLGAEWCDVKNVGSAPLDFSNYRLYHVAYTNQGSEWAPVVDEDVRITGSLLAGQTMRIHSGIVRDLSVLRQEDRSGADLHVFTGRDWFIWNNLRNDTAAVWQPAIKQFVDKASYVAPVPGGVVLIRQGDLLLANPLGTLLGLSSLAGLGGR